MQIGNGAFASVCDLTSIVLPEELKSIAFEGSGLISVRLPESLEQIESYAFYNQVMTEVYIGRATSLEITKLGKTVLRIIVFKC